MAPDQVTIRPRVPADVPLLASALLAQQAETRYPFRDPLPFPVEQFLRADDAVGAWTATLDGRPVGHACRTEQARTMPATGQLNAGCAQAHGCESTDLTWVGALFVAREARGLGVGRRLLEQVVEDARAHDRHPCLEVLPVHPVAMSMYLAMGWQVVGSQRPSWLSDAAGDEGPDIVVMVLTGGGRS